MQSLSDEQLFEAVYLQALDLIEAYPDDETAFSKISSEEKTVYILCIYDMEIQNGGLCQFFVNSSCLLAPYIEDCLTVVGAAEHKRLFADFIQNNNIDANDPDSFVISDTDAYEALKERYGFDAFDDKYMELPSLQSYILDYIKANIDGF